MNILRLPDREIAWTQEGRAGAPAVLLAHGLLSDHRMWDRVVELVSRDFSVLRYDLRGHGRSNAPPAPYTMAQLADDVPVLLDALGLDRVHFVGTSLGGMIGQQLGARHAQRLLSLTLANTGAAQAARQAWEERITVVRRNGVAALADATLDRWFPAAFQRAMPGEIARMRSILLDTSNEGYIGCASAVRDLAQLDLLPLIQVPTLVIAGTLDEAIPHAATAKLAELVRGAKLVSLPTGHQAAVEHPEAFAEAWLAFARGIRA
jgi:3-oxoadipate enol-lactonase